jgi:hypothetical protein
MVAPELERDVVNLDIGVAAPVSSEGQRLPIPIEPGKQTAPPEFSPPDFQTG